MSETTVSNGRRRWLSIRADFWIILAIASDIVREWCDALDRRAADALNDWLVATDEADR